MNNIPARKDNVFRSWNYRLVFFGALVSELGALLYNFAVSFYILQISGNSAFLQGLYLALCGAAMLVFTPVGGVLGDRFNKAKIMYLCDYVKGGMILLATALMLVFTEADAHIAILFALGILGNVISGIFTPAAGALIPHIVAEDRLQQANSYFTIKSSLEGILGVVLAGILYAALPIHTLFFMVGACFVASGISEMMIRYQHTAPAEQLTLRVAVRDMGDGLKYLNMVAERAGAPTYSALTMENVKQEKWFELCWEGIRFLDLVRWGDAAKELAFKSHDKTPYLGDEFYIKGSMGKKTSGLPHKARISFIDDGWAASGGGFKTGKHELYPFPFDVVQLNPWDEEKGVGLKQNPGWE